MSNDIDIGQMISGSTADVSVSDLSRRGFKKVRVLNQAVIKSLIMQAVDRVLEVREEDISRAERQRVIEESRQQFEALVDEKVSAERERAQRAEAELKAREEEVSLLSRELANVRGELEATLAECHRLENEAAGLRQRLGEEQEPNRSAPARTEQESPPSGMGVLELTGMFRELLHELKTSAENQGKQQASDLKQSMELLADRISKGIAAAGGGAHGGAPGGAVCGGDSAEEVMAAFFAMGQTEAVENNLGQVSTKKAQAKKGVAGSLEKLKSMQKSGGTQGGS